MFGMDCLKRWLQADSTRTQAALARELDVAAPTVNEWVHGDSNPSSKRILGLHKATGISLERLYADCQRDAARRKSAKSAA